MTTIINHRALMKIQKRLPKKANLRIYPKELTFKETQMRLFTCPYYDDCLTLAAVLAWTSFICTSCPLYKGDIDNDTKTSREETPAQSSRNNES